MFLDATVTAVQRDKKINTTSVHVKHLNDAEKK